MAEAQYDNEEIDKVYREGAQKLNRPLPGESLTNDPENPYPFEQAPQYTDLKTALEYYFATFTEEGVYENLLEILAGGTPIMDIVQTVLYQGFQEGLFNPDLMMMLAEPLAYMLAAFCEQEDIEFIVQADDEEDMEEEQSLPMMKKAMSQIEVKPEEVPEPVQSLLSPRGDQ